MKMLLKMSSRKLWQFCGHLNALTIFLWCGGCWKQEQQSRKNLLKIFSQCDPYFVWYKFSKIQLYSYRYHVSFNHSICDSTSIQHLRIWWRHQMETFSALVAICAGNSPVNSTHKGQWLGALMFILICAQINGWVSNRNAGDLRRYRPHYDVTVMIKGSVRWRSSVVSSW